MAAVGNAVKQMDAQQIADFESKGSIALAGETLSAGEIKVFLAFALLVCWCSHAITGHLPCSWDRYGAAHEAKGEDNKQISNRSHDQYTNAAECAVCLAESGTSKNSCSMPGIRLGFSLSLTVAVDGHANPCIRSTLQQ